MRRVFLVNHHPLPSTSSDLRFQSSAFRFVDKKSRSFVDLINMKKFGRGKWRTYMSAKISLFTILALLSFGIVMPAMTAHAQTYDNNYACSDNPYDNLPACSNYYDYSYDYPDWDIIPFSGSTSISTTITGTLTGTIMEILIVSGIAISTGTTMGS